MGTDISMPITSSSNSGDSSYIDSYKQVNNTSEDEYYYEEEIEDS